MSRWIGLAAVLAVLGAAAWLARPSAGAFYALQANQRAGPFSSLDVEGAPPGFTEGLRLDPTASPARGTLDDRGLRIGSVWIPAPSIGLVLPPVVAVLLAILLRRVVLCLVVGILAGAWVYAGDPIEGARHAVVDLVWEGSLQGSFNLHVFGFVVFLSMAVGVAHANGGIRGILDVLARWCRTRRATRFTTALSGLVVFFDDYLNTIVVGNSLRPMTDRFRISREKLAYIVDSTAAPIAGLALVSTWVAFETDMLKSALGSTDATIRPYELFLQTVPFRFYCWFTLGFVLMNAWSGRDFGPMRRAEARASAGDVGGPADPALEREDIPRRALNGMFPILVLLLGSAIGLWHFAGNPSSVETVLKTTDSARAFCWAGLAALITALLQTGTQRLLSVGACATAMFRALRGVAPALVILVLAWSIGSLCKELGTGPYVAAVLGNQVSYVAVPVLLFLLAGFTAFSVGSSWTTMAILLPVAVPLSFQVGGLPLLVLTAGAVLDGAIFGDHCSPISDTTVLSSTASLCPHHAHVSTQLPYAFTTMGAGLLLGYVPAALGAPWPLCWLVAFGALGVLLWRFGRPAPEPTGTR